MRKDDPYGRASLGFRAHSGWAAVVAVAGSAASPVAIERRRIELADRAIPGFPQPYHAAQKLELSDAEQLITRCSEAARRLAAQAIHLLIEDLRGKGYDVRSGAILLSSGRPLPSLAATLASHALIHTAEGELFRDAIVHGLEQLRLPITRIREKELIERMGHLERRVSEMGRVLGPPWRQDQKLAMLGACLAL